MGASIASRRLATSADHLPGECDCPVALFLDVDGTLLDIADLPSAVVTPAGLIAALANAERRLEGALALVSGRTIDELDRLFAPLRLRASGVHGAQIRFDPREAVVPSARASELPNSLWVPLTEILQAFPGTFAENKRFSFAVHYRGAHADEAKLRAAIMRLVETVPRNAVEVMNGHCALELKPPGCDKGSAIAAFLSTPAFRGRKPIFIGDDATDETGFAVAAAQGGCAYSVGQRRPGSIGVFSEPRAVRAWLAEFAEGRHGA